MPLTLVLTLGVPMLLGAWLLFDYLLESGHLDKEDIDKQVEAMQARYEKEEEADGDKSHWDPMAYKWMEFGGGFYGLAALYTFALIELGEIGSFITDFPGVSALLSAGPISLIIDFFIDRMMNFVASMLWFTWWGENQIVWNFVIAYSAYYAGMYLAKKDILRRWLS